MAASAADPEVPAAAPGEADDKTAVVRGMRLFGASLGSWSCAHGWISMVVLLLLGGAGILRSNGSPMTELSFDLQWTVIGSKAQRGIRLREELMPDPDTWAAKSTYLIFTPKEDPGADIATRAAFAEMYELLREWAFLQVTHENATYRMADFGAQGLLPAIPPGIVPSFPFGTPTMPIDMLGPMGCFSEQHDFHGGWQMYDQLLAAGDPAVSAMFGAFKPYSNRPSFRAYTSDDQLKAALSGLVDPLLNASTPGVSRGCHGLQHTTLYYADMWSGDTEWEENAEGSADERWRLTRAGGFRYKLAMEASARLAYRLALTQNLSVPVIEAVQRKMSERFAEIVTDFNKNNATVLDCAVLQDISAYVFPRVEAEGKNFDPKYVLIGAALMVVFVYCSLVNFGDWNKSFALAGLRGLLCVAFATVVAIGVYLLAGNFLNSVMLIGLPLLAMGMGVNDMFVLTRYFASMEVSYIKSAELKDIVGELLAKAGPGGLQTSLCNVMMFACGSFLPIQGMADFCLGAAVVSGINFLTMMNVFVPLVLAEEAKRIKVDGTPWDPIQILARSAGCCPRREGPGESSGAKFLKRSMAPVAMHGGCRVGTFLVVCGSIGLCVFLLTSKEIGYSPHELLPSGDSDGKGLEMLFKAFPFFSSWIVFHDLDIPNHQADMMQLYKEVINSTYFVQDPIPNFVSLLALTGTRDAKPACLPPLPAPAHLIPQMAPYVSATNNQTVCDAQHADPQMAPFGTVAPEHFYDAWNAWGGLPTDLPGMIGMWQAQGPVYADMAGYNRFVYAEVDGKRTIKYAWFTVYELYKAAEGQSMQSQFVNGISEIKEIIARSPINESVYVDGPIMNFWEVFQELDSYLTMLVAIGCGVIFLVTLVVFVGDVPVALITAVACTIITLETFGVSAALLKFNIFVGAISLMGMGMAVEFTAHFASAFSTSRCGSCGERVGEAMSHTFPALCEGTMSTFLGVVPLVLDPVMFSVKYLFGMLCITLVVGMFNGVLVMPGLIGLLSPVIVAWEKLTGKAARPEEATTVAPEQKAAPQEDIEWEEKLRAL